MAQQNSDEGKLVPFTNPMQLTPMQTAEIQAVTMSAKVKAEVHAAYMMAMERPRSEDDARVRILAACKSPLFAAKARYQKPVGGSMVQGRWVPKTIQGPSIRFVEEAIRCWRNVYTQRTAIFDDDQKRVISIVTRDLESNTSYGEDVTIEKQVERRSATDRVVIGQRVNTNKDVVYIVKATEDELVTKTNAQASKAIRSNGLRIIPQHIVEEAMQVVDAVLRDKVRADPAAERRALLDGFASRGILPSDVERFMCKPAGQLTEDDLVRLRDMLTAIEDGQATWQEYMEGTQAQTTVMMGEKSQPDTKGAAVGEALGKMAQERGVVLPTTTQPQPTQPAQPADLPQGQPQSTQAEPASTTQPKPTDPTPVIPQDQAQRDAIIEAETALCATDAGVKRYHALIAALHLKLPRGKAPMDVLPKEQWNFYLAQLKNATAAGKN